MASRHEGVVARGIVARGVAAGGLLLLLSGAPALYAGPDATGPGAEAQELPEGVTTAKIEAGKKLFQELGCATCHGEDAAGKPGMTSPLGDAEWKFAEGGTFEELVKVVSSGLPTEKTGGMPMPAAATRNLTEEQVESLAAYVWSISHM